MKDEREFYSLIMRNELVKVKIKVLNYKLGQGRIVLFFNHEIELSLESIVFSKLDG